MLVKDLEIEEKAKFIRGLKKVADGKGIYGSKRYQQQQGNVGYSYVGPADPDGTKLVFTMGLRKFYGSSRANCKPFDPETSLMIDLTGFGWPAGGVEKKTVKLPVAYYGIPEEHANKLQAFLTHTAEILTPNPRPWICITWPDMKAIHANTDFWDYLLSILPESGKIVINCHGGKGRTGTALAALWIAANAHGKVFVPAADAIKYIRDIYHVQAIESKEQEKYIEALAEEWKKELGV
jgi:protein-tyrosine phosphatase